MGNATVLTWASVAAALLFLGGCAATRGQISDGRYCTEKGRRINPRSSGSRNRIYAKWRAKKGTKEVRQDAIPY